MPTNKNIAISAEQNAQKNNPWTDYWKTGASISCVASPGMEAHLTSLWNKYVDELGDDLRILDLATGNGIVALTCESRARVRKINLQIDAVDAANINPDKTTKNPGQPISQVRFQGDIQLESLPFSDDSFSGVVSQFGFEYANEAQTIPEISRVLAPGGQLRLIIHAKDGAVSQDINNRVQRLHSVLAENGPLSLVLALARAAEVGDTDTLRRKSKYFPAAVELAKSLAKQPLPEDSALFYSAEFLRMWDLRSRYHPADLRRSAEHGWHNANGTAIRQEQMLKAARSEEDIRRINESFESAGISIDLVQPVQDSLRNIQNSWLVCGTRR